MKWTGYFKNTYVYKSKIVFFGLLGLLSSVWGFFCYFLTRDILSGEFIKNLQSGMWIAYAFFSIYVILLAYLINPSITTRAQLKKDKDEAIAELFRAVKIKRDLGI